MRKQAVIILIYLMVLPLGGCGVLSISIKKNQTTREELVQKVEQLQGELKAAHEKIDTINVELAALRSFPADRLEHLVHVAKIEFGRFTRPYDENEDGVDDGVLVYLILRDQQGDKIKATGQVTIELWDLAGETGVLLLKKEYGLKELVKYWLTGFLTDLFKIKVPWDKDHEPKHPNLTLKLQFKDALTGRSFELQQLIQIKLKEAKETN